MDEYKERYRHVWEALEKEEKALALEKKKLSEEWVVIEKYQQCYEKDRATFEAMVHAKFAFLPDDEVVQFNIGGKLFKSTVKVWTRDRFSILAHVCTTAPKLARDERGHFYFDRDWWIFKYIYAFLRDKTLPHSLDVLRDLYYEASYYRITLLRHAIEAYLKNHMSGNEAAAKVHHAFVSSDEIYRQPRGAAVPTMTEREWATMSPPASTAATTGSQPVPPKLARRQSITKGKEPELRAPPHVHPIRHEETKSRLNIHVHQPTYDPALDFIDRRQPSHLHQHHHHVRHQRSPDYDHNDSHTDHRNDWHDEYEYPRRDRGYDDDHGRGGGHRRPYEDDRRHPVAFDPRRDMYYADDYGHPRDRHDDWDGRRRPLSSDRRGYEHDTSSREHRGSPHHHVQYDDPRHRQMRGGRQPLSPPLADPHGFLSRRKMSSM